MIDGFEETNKFTRAFFLLPCDLNFYSTLTLLKAMILICNFITRSLFWFMVNEILNSNSLMSYFKLFFTLVFDSI